MLSLLLLIGLPLGNIAYINIEDKVTGESRGSSWAREYDFFTGLNIISEYPLLGIGFDHQRYLSLSPLRAYEDSNLSELGMENRSSSNGLVYLFYTLGIPLGSLFMWGLFRQKLFSHRLLIGALLSLSLFGEALIYTPFVLMIAFSAFTSIRRNTKKNPARMRKALPS